MELAARAAATPPCVPYHDATSTVPSWASSPSAVRSASGLPDASTTSGTRAGRPSAAQRVVERVRGDRLDAEAAGHARAATAGARRRRPGARLVGAEAVSRPTTPSAEHDDGLAEQRPGIEA